MGQMLTLTAEDGHRLAAYRAAPAGKTTRGLVVIQEIFGVNTHIAPRSYLRPSFTHSTNGLDSSSWRPRTLWASSSTVITGMTDCPPVKFS